MRDAQKTLSTRNFYTKENGLILSNPALHAQALYECVSSEKISRLVEDIFRFRVEVYGGLSSGYDLTILSDKLKHAFVDDAPGYESE